MKTLKNDQLIMLANFRAICEERFLEGSMPQCVDVQYNFFAKRCDFKAHFSALTCAVNEYGDIKRDIDGLYEFSLKFSLGDEKVCLNCRPLAYTYTSDGSPVREPEVIANIQSPLKKEKGGVQKCVDGLDEDVFAVGVGDGEAEGSLLSKAEAEFAPNDSPFSNASLE